MKTEQARTSVPIRRSTFVRGSSPRARAVEIHARLPEGDDQQALHYQFLFAFGCLPFGLPGGHDVLALLGRRNLFEALGITPQQAEQLGKLSPPPDRPVDRGWTQLYAAYAEAPAGPLHQQAADDLGDAVRVASQEYHAAHEAFAQAAKRILTPAQLEQLPGG